MAAGTTLTRLLGDLKAVRSPVERMRILARAWRSLRRLRPEERKLLATQVGMEGAEELLEGLGRREKRLAPVAVMQALEKAKKDPARLQGLVRDLKDADKRGRMLRKWLDSVTDDDAQETAPQPEAAPEKEESSAPAPPRSARAIPVAPLPLPVSLPVTAPPVRPMQRKKSKPAAGPKPSAASKPAAAAKPTPQPRRPPLSPPLPAAAPAVTAPPPPTPEPVPARAVPTTAEELRHADGLMTRFRLLRHHLEEQGGRALGPVSQVLEAFPTGWARRRALDALLRRRIPAELDGALALVEELDSPAARRWCSHTILRHWELSTRQEERVRELAAG